MLTVRCTINMQWLSNLVDMTLISMNTCRATSVENAISHNIVHVELSSESVVNSRMGMNTSDTH